MLRKQYADIQRGIDNLLNAIQQGIVTPSTKQRLEDLEKQKSDISVQIVKEEMSKPLLTRDQILFWFHRFRKYNTRRLDHKRRLIDSFINTIYLYDDKMVITFNYKDGSETVSLSEIENSDLSSDLTSSALPKNRQVSTCRFFYPLRKQWYIINNGKLPLLYLISPLGLYIITRSVYKKPFALILYNALH